MKATNIQKIVLLEISDTSQFPDGFQDNYHMHLYCHRGNFEFKFNNQMHQCKAGNFVFWFANSDVSEMSNSKNLKATVLLVKDDFLNDNIAKRGWSIDAHLFSREYPIMHLNDKFGKQKVFENFNALHKKFQENEHRFYDEILKLQMQLFLLEMWHIFANEFERRKRTLLNGSLYERFNQLVKEHCIKEREVIFYSSLLNITPKYLNQICKTNTGITASDWIQRYTKERLVILLRNETLNIAEIADEMEFSSRSFFTRYVKKVLGVTPTEFRQRFQ